VTIQHGFMEFLHARHGVHTAQLKVPLAHTILLFRLQELRRKEG